MSVVQHSSKSDNWHTPPAIIEAARLVLGEFDLDPASCAEANERIGATRYLTKEDDALAQSWAGRLIVNPPGGKLGKQSIPLLFWEKLMAERERLVEDAIWICFSIEQLQTSQGKGFPSMCDFPFCIPKSRVKFIKGETGEPSTSPGHANAVVYIPGRKRVRTGYFQDAFKDIGKVIVPR